MGLETGTYVSDLVPTNPIGASDPKSQGDDHLRLLKAVLQATFPAADKPFYFPNALAKTAAYTVLAADDNKIITADATAAAFTLTLPTLTSTQDGWQVRIIKTDSTVNAVTVGGTINGVVNFSLPRQYDAATFEWTGTAWIALAPDKPTKMRVTTKTADATLTYAEMRGVVLVTPGANPVTMTLPAAAAGEWVYLKNLHASRAVVIDPPGAVTIDGASTFILVGQYESVLIVSDGTNWFIEDYTYAQPRIKPQGYLTLVSATPVITSSQAAKTSVFYALDQGNQVPIPNGSKFTIREFAELTLAIHATLHVANGIYDVFLALDPADNQTIIIGTGPVWTTVTAGSGARGSGAGTTELARLKGMLVNNVAMTLRNGATTYSIGAASALYVGTIQIDSTDGQVTCHIGFGTSRKWGVWNAYNKRRLNLIAGDSTASWTYATATIRQSRGQSANKLTTLCGLAEETIHTRFLQKIGSDSKQGNTLILTEIGIGVNSTTVMSGTKGNISQIAADSAPVEVQATVIAEHAITPALGAQDINCLEFGDTDTSNFAGTEAYMRLSAQWMG